MMNKKLLFLPFLIISAAFAEQIYFNADSMSGTAGNKNSTTSLSGNAKVTTQSMQISADSIELSGKDFRYINAKGNISGKILDSDMDFTCGKLSYDRNTKIATLEENVELIDAENDVRAEAEIIEYNQNTETAVMQIRVHLTQKDNVCTSAHAIYRKTEQLLEMSGNPKIIQNSDTFRAQIIVLDMNTQEIKLTGRVKGSVSTSEEKKESGQKTEENSAAEIPQEAGSSGEETDTAESENRESNPEEENGNAE